jgi:hypothetical protein
MKPIAILILSMGVMGSAVVQAQEGTAVPRQGTVVAQAPGTFTSPGSPVLAAPAAAPAALVPALVVMGATFAGVAAAGTDSGTTVSH